MTDVKKTINDTIDNARDEVHETMHRSGADAEHARRDLAGDMMTPREKVASVANETKERAAAGIDHAKHEVRSRT